ncbi:MAG: FKBP-type peptidyl-prolyl cis-trans isomerase [Oceanicoccus sp.]|jgi:FKBP-type peptidyl-prolyl cis-trans isomerase
MRSKLLLATAVALAVTGCNQQAEQPAPITLDTDQQRVSYGMGIGLGERIKQETFIIDTDAFTQGVKDAVNGAEPMMTEEEIMQQMKAFQEQQVAKQQEETNRVAEDNKAAGDAFLAENATKEGVMTTESGLQYQVMVAGEGAIPAATDTVEVNYAGTLIDGTEFDSSYKRGSSVSFPVNGVIAGWTEALQLMTVGSKWKLFIPSDLAYGPGGTGGGPIGPNAALVFDVELIAIKGAETAVGE